MNAINIQNNISRMAIIQFIYMLYLCAYYIMIYSCILLVNYKRTDTYFNKKVNVETVEEQEESLEEEDEPLANEVEEVVANEVEEVVLSTAENLEKDATLWYTIDDGKGRYKGEWMNGLPNGQGIRHIYKDDSYIYGNFVDGNAEGFCKQTFEQTWEKSQPYYEGNFKRNEYHGKGEYHYGDGNYYKGDWKDSKYHGHGADYSKRLNKTWVGEFCNDEKVEGNYVKGEI